MKMSRAVSIVMLAGAMAIAGVVPGARAQARDFDVPEGYTVIDSIAEFREAIAQSNQKIRMKPGTYRVSGPSPRNVRSTFIVDGVNNIFDLRGVTIEVPTKIYHDMSGPVHSLAGYRIKGDNNTFKDATFENTEHYAPDEALSEFKVSGDGAQFIDCHFIVQGSSPYGYGDILGKGGGSAVATLKHSCMAVTGSNTLIEGCKFNIRAFGHGIHLHRNADNTVIRNIYMRGELRPSNELYKEQAGPVAELDYKLWHPKWKRGQSIPKDEMIHLAEDGIRAYNDKVGRITIENSKVVRMRGGISVSSADQPAKVTDTSVIDCRHGFALPSGSVVRNSRGNAAMGTLLALPRGQNHNTEVELTLLQPHQARGDHVLVSVSGNGHRIRLTTDKDYEPKQDRPIVIGRSGALFAGRWTKARVSEGTLKRRHTAKEVELINDTPHSVRLTKYAQNCQVKSCGTVSDEGTDNKTID